MSANRSRRLISRRQAGEDRSAIPAHPGAVSQTFEPAPPQEYRKCLARSEPGGPEVCGLERLDVAPALALCAVQMPPIALPDVVALAGRAAVWACQTRKGMPNVDRQAGSQADRRPHQSPAPRAPECRKSAGKGRVHG